MGWLVNRAWSTRNELVAHLRRDTAILQARAVGSHFWSVRRYTGSDGITHTYIALDLMRGYGPDQGWGYKDMDESMGPYYYDCPLAYLELADPPASDTIREWRDKVRAHHALKKKTPRPVAGMLATYGGQQYRLTRCLERRAWEVVHVASGVVYRMKASQVARAMSALVPTAKEIRA